MITGVGVTTHGFTCLVHNSILHQYRCAAASRCNVRAACQHLCWGCHHVRAYPYDVLLHQLCAEECLPRCHRCTEFFKIVSEYLSRHLSPELGIRNCTASGGLHQLIWMLAAHLLPWQHCQVPALVQLVELPTCTEIDGDCVLESPGPKFHWQNGPVMCPAPLSSGGA